MRGRCVAAICLCAAFTMPAYATEPWREALRDGFEGQDFAEEGGLYYRDNAEQRAGSAVFQNKVVRTGKGALELSVKALCPADDDDCSERAEIWELTELRVPYDQGVWYGFAVKFADPVPQDDHRYLIAQWKREIESGANGDFSPFLALRLSRGKLFATVETNLLPAAANAGKTDEVATCTSGLAPAWLRADTNQTRALVATDANFKPEDGELFHACVEGIKITDRGNKLPDPNSGWIDFAVYTRPGPDGTGQIELFANGKWIVSVTGHIGHDDKGLGRHQYFKFGPYRAGTSGSWTLYYDDFRRSPACEDVLVGPPCPSVE